MGADMSTLSSLISGGGGALPQIALTHSQTWVPPQDGNICIHLFGAGGSGDGKNNSQFSGGAGGYCRKNSLAVTTSGSYTVLVGVAPRTSNDAVAVAGGNTTFAGTGLSSTLTANGGTLQSGDYGAGGTASNGDVTRTGGAGNIYGGGAVGIHGTGQAGAGNDDRYGGGSSDAQGGVSGFGHIAGGGSGGMYQQGQDIFNARDGDAGPMAGGGTAYNTSSGSYTYGGNGGSPGGGGGAGRNLGSATVSVGGMGGQGLVLIQYLPS